MRLGRPDSPRPEEVLMDGREVQQHDSDAPDYRSRRASAVTPRKSWQDRRGATPLVIIAVIAVIVAIVAVAWIALANRYALSNIYDPPDADVDGDGKPDPIIGHVQISAIIHWDNQEISKDRKPFVETVSAKFVAGVPGAQFYELGFNALQGDFKVEFRLVSPGLANYRFVDDITQSWQVGGVTDNDKKYEVRPIDAAAVKYHGPYQLTVILYEAGNNSPISSKTIDIQI